MRIELNMPVRNESDVLKVCQQAKEWNVDALYMPPLFLEAAAHWLGRSEINLVTTVARPADLLDTKIAGIDASVKAGADELILCVDTHLIHEGNWSAIEKELEQLKIAASAYRKFLWIGCKFQNLIRVNQVKMAEAIGSVGLRAAGLETNDIALAKICGLNHICLGASNPDPEPEAIENFRQFGVTQFVFTDKPPKEKTDKVEFHAV